MPVAPLITADDLMDRFDIDSDINSGRLIPHVGSASRRLRRWVGETTYATADEDIKADLQNAEAHLAYHFAIWGINSPLSAKGIVATAMSGEGKELRKYLTPDETAKASNYFLELAREIAEPYMLSDGTPGPSYEITDGEC